MTKHEVDIEYLKHDIRVLQEENNRLKEENEMLKKLLEYEKTRKRLVIYKKEGWNNAEI